MDAAVSLVRFSWMTESVAVLMPWPVLAIRWALTSIRLAADVVRARSTKLINVATDTTATATTLIIAAAPDSPPYPLRRMLTDNGSTPPWDFIDRRPEPVRPASP